jgi:hypothetical protein
MASVVLDPQPHCNGGLFQQWAHPSNLDVIDQDQIGCDCMRRDLNASETMNQRLCQRKYNACIVSKHH